VILIVLIDNSAKNTNNNQSICPAEYHTIIHILNESMGCCENRISFNTIFFSVLLNRMII